MIVTREEGSDVGRDEILAYLDGKIAKWWMPDDVVFMDEMPHTATGKLHKLKLREAFKDYVLPSVEAAAAGE